MILYSSTLWYICTYWRHVQLFIFFHNIQYPLHLLFCPRFVLKNCIAVEECLLSNFQNVSGEFCIQTPSTFCTLGGLRRKCHSVLSAKYTSFVILLQVLLTATAHRTHYKTPRSKKSFFCFLLVIIILSLPYSFDRVLNDQELRQHSNFNAWLDFNLQI